MNCELINCKKNVEKAIEIMKSLEGLGKDFIVLLEFDKKAIAEMPEGKGVVNTGVVEALSREITIAFSHNEKFRPSPCAIVLLSCKGKIVGEMTDSGKKYYGGTKKSDGCVLPAIPFPELELDGAFDNVCSASPGYVADVFLRTRIKVKKNDATLLVGFDIKKEFHNC